MQDRDTRLINDAIDYLQAQTRLINSPALRKDTAARLRVLANELDTPELIQLSPENRVKRLEEACNAENWDEVSAHARALRASALNILKDQAKIATEKNEWHRIGEPLLLLAGLVTLSTPICRIEKLHRKIIKLAASFFPSAPLMMANVIAFPMR
jgi:hypothetical protein